MKRSLSPRYGKWAMVAGASRGFGASFALELARRGMNVVLVARQGHLLENLADRLHSEHGVEARCVALDLAEPDFAQAIGNAVAGLDPGILIYNAACVPVGRFVEMEQDALEQVIRVNVRGPLLLARALLPAMCDRGRGAVVLVSSLAGLQGAPRDRRLFGQQGIQHRPRRSLVGRVARAGHRRFRLLRRCDAHPGLPCLHGSGIAWHAVAG